MKTSEQRLSRHSLSLLGAWSLAIGTSVGWGSLVVTSNNYLSQAGPLGCDIVQGYYFSKPVPAAAFEPFILQRGQ